MWSLEGIGLENPTELGGVPEDSLCQKLYEVVLTTKYATFTKRSYIKNSLDGQYWKMKAVENE